MSLIDGQAKAQTGCTLGGCFAFSVFVIFCGALTLGFMGYTGSADDAKADTTNDTAASKWTGSSDTVATLKVKKGGKTYTVKMPETSGKIGHEQHDTKQSCFKSGEKHIAGAFADMAAGSVTNCMAFGAPRTGEQEEWYFNMRWDTGGGYPRNIEHVKVIITNPKNGKRIVASIEEYGPAAFLKSRDGIVAGAPPDVYKYLGLAGPYTGHPNDKKGYAEFAFAKDQSIPLGPLK